jgi:hypothetical protein
MIIDFALEKLPPMSRDESCVARHPQVNPAKPLLRVANHLRMAGIAGDARRIRITSDTQSNVGVSSTRMPPTVRCQTVWCFGYSTVADAIIGAS